MQFLTKGVVCAFLLLLGTQLSALSRSANTDITKIRLTISLQSVTLKEAFERIEQASPVPVSFLYDEEQVNVKKTVTASFKDTSLKEILEAILFRNGCEYKVNDNVILISPAKIKKVSTPPPVRTGSIRGNIYDEQSHEALVGANVMIEGTPTGAAADVDGNFAFRNLQPGYYTLVVSFIGYQPKKLENIQVTESNEAKISVALAPGSESLSEIVVIGSVDVRHTPIKNSTEESLISEIKESNNIVTGISNLQIARSLDRDAADVMKRVPGVSVLNNFIIVRGLDPRYNVTFLNGMLMPSTESDSRAFAFNLIPSGLIDDIKIYKLPAPELPGGFGGGVIKVNTKKSQVARRIQLDISTQYRTGGASFSDFYTGSNDSKKDWIVWGVKEREMPAQFRDKKNELPRLDMYPGERMAAIRTLPSVNQIEEGQHSLDRRLSLNYYDSWKLGSIRFSNLTAIGYSYQRDFDRREVMERATLGDSITVDNRKYLRPQYQSVDSVYSEDVRLSLLESVGFLFNENHRIDVNVFANRSAQDNTLLTAESLGDGDQPLIPGHPAPKRSASFEYKLRDMLAGAMAGSHVLGRHSIQWQAGLNKMSEYIPDWQIFSFLHEQIGDPDSTYYTLDINSEGTLSPAVPRQYYLTEETRKNFSLDYEIKIAPHITVKAGTLVQLGERSFTNINYTYTFPQTDNSVYDEYHAQYEPWRNVSTILSDENFKDDATGFNLVMGSGAESYSYTQNITAFYGALKISLMKNRLELYGGLRYENEYTQLYDSEGKPIRTYQEYDYETETVVDRSLSGPDFNYFLPSFNLTWNITDKHKIRAGYGKSLDRPAFRERSNAKYFSIRDGVNYQGNLALQNAELDNIDLRWEWYPTESEFVAFGSYYKYIDKPIEVYEFGQSGWTRLARSWTNKNSAELYGLEFEARKNLGFIPMPYSGRFSVIINASWIYTKVDENFENSRVRPTRPLTGSSPYIVNLSLYYESQRSKTVISAAYNLIGSRLIATSVAYAGNLHERSQHLLDLVIIQPVGKYVKIKAGVQNLLNLDVVRWRDGNFDGKYTPGKYKDASSLIDPWFANRTDHEGERWNPGSYYSLGLNLTF